SFGNRYFSVVAMVLAFFVAEAGSEIERSSALRRAWGWSFAASFLIHALGAFFTWPGVALTVQDQVATLWHLRMHPFAYLFVAEGPLGGLPLPARVALACGFLALSWPLARFIERRSAPL
ncbi:MAG: hypothetical protein ABL955_05020, partial [Elusimicrobiota bacterium]